MPTDQSDPELTAEQREVLLHTLGLNRKSESYRNHYCCEADDPSLARLVGLGLMEPIGTSIPTVSPMWCATAAGRALAKRLT